MNCNEIQIDATLNRLKELIMKRVTDEFYMLASTNVEDPIISFAIYNKGDGNLMVVAGDYQLTKKDIKETNKFMEERYIKGEE